MRGIPGVSVIGWAWASADGGDLRKILESGVSGPRDAALLYGRQPGAVGSDDRVMAWGDEGDTMPYKYGRRPPKNAPALRFGSFLSSAAPAHPRDEDYLAKLSDWQMLGNDVAGDCNAVTWANMRRLVTATLTTEYYPTQEQVWQFTRHKIRASIRTAPAAPTGREAARTGAWTSRRAWSTCTRPAAQMA